MRLLNIKTRLLLALLAVLALAAASACSSGEEENNVNANAPDAVTPFKSPNIFDPAQPAADFALSDHEGREVKLSTLKGKPVVLTFLYTNCPDVCPIITAKLNQTIQLLGPDASKVVIVAVTVDPERDTQARAKQYSDQQGIGDKWHFVIAPDAALLQPVWEAYGVYQQREKALSEQQGTPHPESPYTVAHSAPVHVIDKDGNKKLAYGGFELLPEDLAHDLKLLF